MPSTQFSGFEEFLATQSVQIPLLSFSLNLLLAALLAFGLGRIYIRYGSSISNRKLFANNLVSIAMATMVVISIVKSSLALSLGLVGALSIVRFRAAIKEPEELIYLFIAIAIGLGMGADQAPIIFVAFALFALVIFAQSFRSAQRNEDNNLYITVSSEGNGDVSLSKITDIISSFCKAVDLKRYDHTADGMEAVYHTNIANYASLEGIQRKLEEIDKDIKIAFLDQRGIVT